MGMQSSHICCACLHALLAKQWLTQLDTQAAAHHSPQ